MILGNKHDINPFRWVTGTLKPPHYAQMASIRAIIMPQRSYCSSAYLPETKSLERIFKKVIPTSPRVYESHVWVHRFGDAIQDVESE